MAVDALRETVTTLLKRSELLHQSVMRWKSRHTPSLLVVPGETRLVVEAFPRSANSYLVRMMKAANPGLDNESMCHHTHSIHSVKRAVKFSIPALVIIRNPVDAITSACIKQNHLHPDFVSALVREYLDFYGPLGEHLDDIVLIEFEEAVGGDLNDIAAKLNRRYGTAFSTSADTGELRRQVEDEIRANSPHRHSPMRIPIPTEERRAVSSSVRADVERHPRIGDAKSLYTALVARLADV